MEFLYNHVSRTGTGPNDVQGIKPGTCPSMKIMSQSVDSLHRRALFLISFSPSKNSGIKKPQAQSPSWPSSSVLTFEVMSSVGNWLDPNCGPNPQNRGAEKQSGEAL